MNKFQKLYQINKDIELLENAGKIKAANVLHNKFIKEAQYAMPQMMPMMMPQMMMPQMMPQMMPMMMARPVAPAAAARPAVAPTTAPVATPTQVSKTTPAPVQQGQIGQVTVPVPQPSPTPSPAPAPPPTNKEIKPPYTGPTPPTTPPTNYGNQQNKDQELQYIENELARLRKEYGPDCGSFKSQCDILEQMLQKNKGGSVVKG